MQIDEIYETHKKRLAVVAALILLVFFWVVIWANTGGMAPPESKIQISLVPKIPLPKPKPPEAPKEQPKPPKVEKKPPKKQADVIRADEEKKRKEEEEKQRKKEEAEKKAKEKKAKEKKRKADEKKEKERKEKLEKEKKRKEEEEKQRKEEEKKRKEEKEEAERQAEAVAAAAAADAQRRQGLQNRVSRIASGIAGRIINRIDDYLKTPIGIPEDSSIVVKVHVRLNPDGSLNGIPEVIESSGFPKYDDAAVRAVLLAAPLPMPKESFIVNDEEFMKEFLEHTLSISPTL
ncbi:MAG: cell envelope integrity protein TolA [Proteobacteria bacterium]|nr:cell envelope integrity protein TolA [Pseudomonadota bacterium]